MERGRNALKEMQPKKIGPHSLSAIDSFIYIYPITSLQLYVTSYWAKNDQSLDHWRLDFFNPKNQ